MQERKSQEIPRVLLSKHYFQSSKSQRSSAKHYNFNHLSFKSHFHEARYLSTLLRFTRGYRDGFGFYRIDGPVKIYSLNAIEKEEVQNTSMSLSQKEQNHPSKLTSLFL